MDVDQQVQVVSEGHQGTSDATGDVMEKECVCVWIWVCVYLCVCVIVVWVWVWKGGNWHLCLCYASAPRIHRADSQQILQTNHT